ncbi:MAG: hypothetical protein V5B32_10400 [Candidatus Accumulibacter sp. UW26]
MRKKPVSGHWVMARTVRHMGLLALAGVLLSGSPARADSSGAQLAAYYDRQMVIRDGIAYGWSGSERPQPMISDVIQVGVGKDSYYALRKDGTLLTWSSSPANAALLMREVVGFAAGSSGWLAINRTRSLWQGSGREPPRKIAERVIAAAVGDGSDYYIDQAGDLYVRSQANRSQSGNGRPVASGEFVRTAARVAAVRAHSGRSLYLTKSGEVFAIGGNAAGPSKQGPGDQATAAGSLFTGASGVATGAAHSAAIRPDGSLWAWGSGFGSEAKKIAEQVVTVAAGSTSTIALTADGKVLAWDAGRGPRQIILDR